MPTYTIKKPPSAVTGGRMDIVFGVIAFVALEMFLSMYESYLEMF